MMNRGLGAAGPTRSYSCRSAQDAATLDDNRHAHGKSGHLEACGSTTGPSTSHGEGVRRNPFSRTPVTLRAAHPASQRRFAPLMNSVSRGHKSADAAAVPSGVPPKSKPNLEFPTTGRAVISR